MILIKLNRLNNTEYFLNSDIIETIEMTPDTVITTVHGKKYVVLETADEIIDRIAEYRKRIYFFGAGALQPPAGS